MESFISICFDDGWKSAIDRAHPILFHRGVEATFYIISDHVGKKGYMNEHDLMHLAEEGHEIGSHTRSHPHLTELPKDEVIKEIKAGRDDLEKMGFQISTFAYPYGDWNPHVAKQVREAGFLAGRSIIRGVNDIYTDTRLLKAYGVNREHGWEDIVSWIMEFKERESAWLILFFHQIEAFKTLQEKEMIYGTTPEILDEILGFIDVSEIPILTVEKGVQKMLQG